MKPTPMPELTDAAIDERIRQHRMTTATLTIKDASGHPLAGTQVSLKQTRHQFLFGANGFNLLKCDTRQDLANYRKHFAALLNFATLPFYWGGYEPEPGQPAAASRQEMAAWCQSHGIRPKGHPLCWHEVPCRWLEGKSRGQVEKLQLARIAREVGGFAGIIDVWDVLNEVCIMPDWDRQEFRAVPRLCRHLGRIELIKRCLREARRANPRATLILNDFNTGPQYEELIADGLRAKADFDVIGIQSHMHCGYWGAARTWEILERFARFGLPLHFSEVTLLSGRLKTDSDWHTHRPRWATTRAGEKRQEREVVEFYRILFSHPAVDAITWWDFADQGSWQGAPSGFLRADMSPKPAYESLLRLVKQEWWTPRQTLTTDAAGRLSFTGFLGEYEICAGGRRAAVELSGVGVFRKAVRLPAD